jgi:hypothetical protein
MKSFPHFLLGWHCLILACAPSAKAQSTSTPAAFPISSPAVAASAEGSRLRQMEAIYQQQLRARHIPLLGNYLTLLQRLAAQAADPEPYKQEMQRIQDIVSSGAVVDLTAAVQALRAPAEMPMPAPPPPPRKVQRALIALTPSLARSISPLPSTSASPAAAAIGEIEWRIESLPAGSYELVLQYSLPAAQDPVTVEVEYAGQRLKMDLSGENAAAKGTFPLLRLGQLNLEREERGEILRLRAGAKDSASMLLRELVITRARANP